MDDVFIKYDIPNLGDDLPKFKEFDKVNYLGANGMRPYRGTFIWAILAHQLVLYVIEHPDGFPKEHFISDFLSGNFPDGFEAVHSTQLQDGLTYVYAEADKLEMVEAYIPK